MTTDTRSTQQTLAVVDRFNEAFARHDVDAVMALMTDDCVFESTGPAPDGGRFQGQGAVRRVWDELFAGSPGAEFLMEETFACGDRCTQRWVYSWRDVDGNPGHVRGVDVMRIRDGKVAEKFSYVKG
jgi:ketosteroid isomerase-like protein